MEVYQLELLDLGFCLEPVFKTKESAEKIKEKYPNRKIQIRSTFIGDIKDNIIYRIKNNEDNEYTLEDSIFSSIESAKSHIKDNTQEIVMECLHG